MPGNTVKINNAVGMNWYVGDSKIDEVIETLNRVGTKLNGDAPDKVRKSRRRYGLDAFNDRHEPARR